MSVGPRHVLEVSIQVFCPFFNWAFCLPAVESCEFFIYFGDPTLVWGIMGKYVFPYSWFSHLISVLHHLLFDLSQVWVCQHLSKYYFPLFSWTNKCFCLRNQSLVCSKAAVGMMVGTGGNLEPYGLDLSPSSTRLPVLPAACINLT